MIVYSKTQKPDTLEAYFEKLQKAGKQGWTFSHCEFGYMIFYKEQKKTLEKKVWEKTKEFIEFIEYYKKNITTNWAYAETLARKYDIVLEKNKHEDIMENLALYKIHLATHKQKPPCQPATYLNWNRFLEKWEVIKTTVENKWQDDIMKERGYTVEQIKAIQYGSEFGWFRETYIIDDIQRFEYHEWANTIIEFDFCEDYPEEQNQLTANRFNLIWDNKKIIWHYDITAVDKYIRSSKDFAFVFENGIDYMCYSFSTGDNSWDDDGYYLPNKPLPLYTEEEDKNLLTLLQKLWTKHK